MAATFYAGNKTRTQRPPGNRVLFKQQPELWPVIFTSIKAAGQQSAPGVFRSVDGPPFGITKR